MIVIRYGFSINRYCVRCVSTVDNFRKMQVTPDVSVTETTKISFQVYYLHLEVESFRAQGKLYGRRDSIK